MRNAENVVKGVITQKNCPNLAKTSPGKNKSTTESFAACVTVTSLINSPQLSLNKNAWILDSACTTHVCNKKLFLSIFKYRC